MRRFGVFELDRATGELKKRGVRVRLQEQPLAILDALLEQPGELIGRDTLKERLWPDDPAYRTDDNLNRAAAIIAPLLCLSCCCHPCTHQPTRANTTSPPPQQQPAFERVVQAQQQQGQREVGALSTGAGGVAQP